ncbi:GNAT family N-acetyltransferase [Flavonifractor plautii]|nr:GNAT family N-acetyltransferase [Flavonifractor plautii]
MDLRPIPARDWADWYTGELCASFPACECKPLEAIRALAAEGRYELLGLCDGAALLGYATLWSTPEWPDYVLLDYLGVTAARRNGGLGGAILKMLAAREAGRRTVLVEAEAERSGGPEEEAAPAAAPPGVLCPKRLHPRVRELQLRPALPGLCAGARPGGSGGPQGGSPCHLRPGPDGRGHRPAPGASPEPPYWM